MPAKPLRKMDAAAAWSRCCYGVDAGGARPIIVRATRAGGRLAFSRLEAEAPAFHTPAGSGRTVIAACLLERESFTRWLETPFASRAKSEKVLPAVLDIQLPFPLEDCLYTFLDAVAGAGGNTRVLAVAARRDDVEKRIATLRELGLDPLLLDQEGLALWSQSLAEAPTADEAACRVVVYLAADRATAVLGRGQTFLAAQTARLARADEIDRLLRAKLRPAPAAVNWYWTGPAASDPAVRGPLQEGLAAKWPGTFQLHRDPDTFLARALATRALTPGPLRCNLRMGALAHPGLTRQAQARSFATALFCLACGILLCGINLAWSRAVQHREAALQTATTQLARQICGRQDVPKGTEVLMAGRALEKETAQLAPFIRPFGRSHVATLRDLVETARKNGLLYESLALSDNAVTLQGTARDWDQCDKLSRHVQELGFKVKLDRQGTLTDERVHFAIAPLGGATP